MSLVCSANFAHRFDELKQLSYPDSYASYAFLFISDCDYRLYLNSVKTVHIRLLVSSTKNEFKIQFNAKRRAAAVVAQIVKNVH